MRQILTPKLDERTASIFAIAAFTVALIAPSNALAQQTITPGKMPRLGAVDPRFQSYNIEMVEVTGGPFWKPYAASDTAGPDQNRYSYRPPLDLANARLRKLAAALGPAYVRVSGTWANSTYFAGPEGASHPPPGYNSILTRTQWHGVIDFARAASAEIVTSFAISPGARDAAGRWMPDQARRLVAYTSSLGARIAAVEFMNEPNLASQNGAPADYDASAYAHDFGVFREFIRSASPHTLIAGPGSVGESAGEHSAMPARDLFRAIAADIDVVSYHHYNTISRRCGGRDSAVQALSGKWLGQTDQTLGFYKALRNEFTPGKPIWLTETAGAACGGNPWEATYLDTFRYLDQLGGLAKAGVEVIMHNTLAGSDYGLLDERTFAPRPNYWGALLWHRLMGAIVLDPGLPAQAGLRVYAHCDPVGGGGVSILAINTSPDKPLSLALPLASERYDLRASSLQNGNVRLNGKPLALSADDALPTLAGVPTPAGVVALDPASITFLAIASAANPACR